jgi:hypothetical protein
MLKKRLRMVLDFEVTVEEVTDEVLREYYRQFTNYEEMVGDKELWTNISRQTRLQQVLLKDEEALRRFLTHVVTSEVDSTLDSRIGEVFGVGGVRAEEEILEPLFSRLGDEDKGYFREVNEAGALFEAIEVLSRSIRGRWMGASLEEVKLVVEGSFDLEA